MIDSDGNVTLNGKKVESAVTNIINGRKVTNRDALLNPDSRFQPDAHLIIAGDKDAGLRLMEKE